MTADEFVDQVRSRVLATRQSVPAANEDTERGHCWRVGVAHGARVAYEMLRPIDQPQTRITDTGFTHGHQWNAHAICVRCRREAKDLLGKGGMYPPCAAALNGGSPAAPAIGQLVSIPTDSRCQGSVPFRAS